MKICVTGGTGLVGNAVKKFANNLKQHEFYYVSRSFATDNNNKGIDLTNIREVEEYFKKHKFDYIINHNPLSSVAPCDCIVLY